MSDLFSPPSKEELAEIKKIQPNKKEPSLLEPPSEDELIELGVKKPEKDPSMLSKGFEYGMRALDYPAGLIRTGAAGIANIPYAIATGKSFVGPEDVESAFKGEAPGVSEYMERAGVGEGPDVAGISARDVGGFLGDVALDPLGLLTKGARAAKFARPASEAAEALGKKSFKSGLKKIDEKLAETGAKPVSDVLLERGIAAGTTKSLAKKAQKIGKELRDERQRLYKMADESGEMVDMKKATQGAEEVINEMLDNPGLEEAGLKMLDKIYKYRARGKVPVSTASKWKTELYDALPQSAFKVTGQLKGKAGEVHQALARGFKDEIINTANRVQDGLGNKINKVNEDWGSIIQAAKPLEKQISRGNTTNAFTSMDAMLLGVMGAAGGPATSAGALALKKGADIGKTTFARSGLGKGLINLGKTGILDDASRRGLIESGRDNE